MREGQTLAVVPLEISYGINREIVVRALEGYIASLKACGWIEYEQERNHQLNVVLYEYAISIIESMNRIIREEEAEYQSISFSMTEE